MAENFPHMPEPFFLYVDDIDGNPATDNGDKQDAHKTGKSDPLPKLLFDHSLSLPKINSRTTQKKFEIVAEENLLRKDLQETCCTIPGNPKSTFLMVFSPDGSKVASSHGDHNINVTDLRTKKCITTLTGHPRTPWCIAFHPYRNDILASGCLGGQVRVWDLHGGSEMWSIMTSEVTTVIASLAFHPSERLLVIATNSTLYFWDWNIPQPFAKCSTANEKQKLRYVSFDPLGNWLLTGISNAPGSSASLASSSSIGSATSGLPVPGGLTPFQRAERLEQERERNLQSRYQILLDQYERLRVRYQELRHRAAELELNANSNQSPTNEPTAETASTRNPSHPAADASLLNGSSSDQFWRTLMNAAENLRELSNIGRSLNNPSTSNAGPSRPTRPSLDHDARVRIQLLSRHIEDMQRICLSHIEMTRHRRQVYRLQQIRRILEDLREQIRYLQDCVRDNLDLVTRLRTTANSPPAGPSGINSRSSTISANSQRPSPSTSGDRRPTVAHTGPSKVRTFTTIQNRRFNRFLAGRMRRNSNAQERLRTPFGRDGRFRFRMGCSPVERLTILVNPLEQIGPQPGTSHDSSDPDDGVNEEPSLERGVGYRNLSSTDCASNSPLRSRFARQLHRTVPRSNSLLHLRNLPIQRRRPSILSRVLQGRTLQNQVRTTSDPAPSMSSSQTTREEASRRLADQSLRPLMERLESHFRLQRQTLGILAQLNESAGTSFRSSSSEYGGSSDASNADGTSSPRMWASNVFRNIRQWRSRREPLERGHSLDSRTPGTDRFQIPRRVGGAGLHFVPTYRAILHGEDDDSSDTDTDMTSDSASGSFQWRHSSPIRSPGGVEQRMRLLWREYLSQVVNAQGPNAAEGQSGAEQNSSTGDAMADQERSRYRMWLSTMVESLTSFFSQHGINSSESDPPTNAPPPVTTPPRPPPLSSNLYANRAQTDDGPSSPGVNRPPEQLPWRIFPRGSLATGLNQSPNPSAAGPAAAAGESFAGQHRWNLRRNAESQVSLSAHLTYRIQAWDFNAKGGIIPDICDPASNIVVRESKIHNDASVDVSQDGRFLVTLTPCSSLTGACVSVHSLQPSRLGQCLAQVSVDQFVVSVSISPTCRHLLLGLASSRAVTVISRDPSLPTLWAKVFEIPTRVFDSRTRANSTTADAAAAGANEVRPGASGWRPGVRGPARRRSALLPLAREIPQTSDVGSTSLNCIRWIPTAGQGFVLGTNKGHLKVIN